MFHGLSWFSGFYDTRSMWSDRISADHVRAAGWKTLWFGWQQKDGPKSVLQGLSSFVKDGVDSEENLMSAISAPIRFERFNEVGPMVPTLSTAEPVWPFAPDETL